MTLLLSILAVPVILLAIVGLYLMVDAKRMADDIEGKGRK